MDNLTVLKNLTLAPYILKATALIGVGRKVGGNQFRHSFATLGILLDYKYFEDSVLLKASLLHDLIEDLGVEDLNEIRYIDSDGTDVVNLVLEVTRDEKSETKEEYLKRLQYSSLKAKILKCADRISNLTDLHLDTHSDKKIHDYLNQTEEYILPLAREVNVNFENELLDLISKRRNLLIITESQNEKPYNIIEKVVVEKVFNSKYGYDRICECGHPYYRHFDTYADMYNCGCKYCGCQNFVEKVEI